MNQDMHLWKFEIHSPLEKREFIFLEEFHISITAFCTLHLEGMEVSN